MAFPRTWFKILPSSKSSRTTRPPDPKMEGMRAADISSRIAALAQEAGFTTAGIAPVPPPGDPEDYPELSHFAPWIERGRAGEMRYPRAPRRRRSAFAVVLADCRSLGALGDCMRSQLSRGRAPAPWIRSRLNPRGLLVTLKPASPRRNRWPASQPTTTTYYSPGLRISTKLCSNR